MCVALGKYSHNRKNSNEAKEIKKPSDNRAVVAGYAPKKNETTTFLQMIIIFIKKKVEIFTVSLKLYFQIHLLAKKVTHFIEVPQTVPVFIHKRRE